MTKYKKTTKHIKKQTKTKNDNNEQQRQQSKRQKTKKNLQIIRKQHKSTKKHIN